MEERLEGKCHHYWVIESPGGPTSKGVCRLCGAKKDFYNSWRYLVEEIVKPVKRTKRGGVACGD